MVNFKLSHRYAFTLLESAIEKKMLGKVHSDINVISLIINESRDLRLALQSPVIKREIKYNILSELFGKRISKETMNFIKFIVDNKREEFLGSIAERFLVLYDEQKGISRAAVKTAFAFSEDQKKALQDKLEILINKKVLIEYKVDESMIGGFIAQVGDTLYDASLKHQLELLRKEFLKGGATLN